MSESGKARSESVCLQKVESVWEKQDVGVCAERIESLRGGKQEVRVAADTMKNHSEGKQEQWPVFSFGHGCGQE